MNDSNKCPRSNKYVMLDVFNSVPLRVHKQIVSRVPSQSIFLRVSVSNRYTLAIRLHRLCWTYKRMAGLLIGRRLNSEIDNGIRFVFLCAVV